MHEILINLDEMRSTWENDSMYIIADPNQDDKEIQQFYPEFSKAKPDIEYSSNNVEKIPKEVLKELLTKNKLI